MAAIGPREVVGVPALPPGFFVEDAGGGAYDTPVDVAFAPDGRMFVAEKRGMVWVVRDGERLAAPFIDLRTEVLSHHDRGLLGITLDPAFAENGRVYLVYTVDRNGTGDYPRTDVFARLVRYTASAADPDRADSISGKDAAALQTILEEWKWADGSRLTSKRK